MNNSGYNLTSLDAESLDNDFITRYTKEMREKYLSFWHSLENSENLNFIELEYSTSDYVYQLRH